MVSAGDFRNGVTLEIDGQVVQIMEFQHVKPGKGAAFVRTKLKNVINGGVVERTFRPTEKFPAARIDRVDMQYLYADGALQLHGQQHLRAGCLKQGYRWRCLKVREGKRSCLGMLL